MLILKLYSAHLIFALILSIYFYFIKENLNGLRDATIEYKRSRNLGSILSKYSHVVTYTC